MACCLASMLAYRLACQADNLGAGWLLLLLQGLLEIAKDFAIVMAISLEDSLLLGASLPVEIPEQGHLLRRGRAGSIQIEPVLLALFWSLFCSLPPSIIGRPRGKGVSLLPVLGCSGLFSLFWPVLEPGSRDLSWREESYLPIQAEACSQSLRLAIQEQEGISRSYPYALDLEASLASIPGSCCLVSSSIDQPGC